MIYIKRASNFSDYRCYRKWSIDFYETLPPILNQAQENDFVKSRIEEN